MHGGAALAALMKLCSLFMQSWSCCRGRRPGRGGGPEKGPRSTLMALIGLMATALNSDLMIPRSFKGVKLTL